MNVLVVARTRYGAERVCVGGIDVDTGAGVRLLGHDGQYLLATHQIRPREVWSLTCSPNENIEPPHVEDLIVTRGSRMDVVADMRAAIMKLIAPWTGDLDRIFDGTLETTSSGRAFVREGARLPQQSTGFWVVSQPVRKSKFEERGTSYWFPEGRHIRAVKYVGMEDPAEEIPDGALVRFSLAKWKAFPQDAERRCYLQVSGWFL